MLCLSLWICKERFFSFLLYIVNSSYFWLELLMLCGCKCIFVFKWIVTEKVEFQLDFNKVN